MALVRILEVALLILVSPTLLLVTFLGSVPCGYTIFWFSKSGITLTWAVTIIDVVACVWIFW